MASVGPQDTETGLLPTDRLLTCRGGAPACSSRGPLILLLLGGRCPLPALGATCLHRQLCSMSVAASSSSGSMVSAQGPAVVPTAPPGTVFTSQTVLGCPFVGSSGAPRTF